MTIYYILEYLPKQLLLSCYSDNILDVVPVSLVLIYFGFDNFLSIPNLNIFQATK